MTTENQEEETAVFVDSFKMTNEDFNEYLVQSKLDPKLFKKYYKYLTERIK